MNNMENKKNIVVLALHHSDFRRWLAENGKPDEEYIFVNNNNYDHVLRGARFSEIVETERSYLLKAEVFEMAESRLVKDAKK